MRDFLAGWIVAQLIILGVAEGLVRDEVNRGIYQCGETPNSHDWIAGVFIPLVIFVPTDQMVAKYCEGK